jgi:hypothetical protein
VFAPFNRVALDWLRAAEAAEAEAAAAEAAAADDDDDPCRSWRSRVKVEVNVLDAAVTPEVVLTSSVAATATAGGLAFVSVDDDFLLPIDAACRMPRQHHDTNTRDTLYEARQIDVTIAMHDVRTCHRRMPEKDSDMEEEEEKEDRRYF